MKSNDFVSFVKQRVDQAFEEADQLKEMWKDPNKAAQIRTMLDIMSNDQDALKQLNNTMRIALEMDKRLDRVNSINRADDDQGPGGVH